MRRHLLTTCVAAMGLAWSASALAQQPPPYQPPYPPQPYPPPQQPYYPPPQQQQQPYYPPPQQQQQPYYPPPQQQPYYPPPQQQQQPYYPPPNYQPYPQQPYPPPQPPPPPPKEKKPGWDLDSEVWGLRGTSLHVAGGDHPESTLGLGLGSIGLANGQDKVFSYRGESVGHLGGGSGGFEGALYGSLTLGASWLADGKHGPFIRGGFQGQIQGNDSFYLSSIRFPRGELGWHIGSRDGFMLEIGGDAAPTLDGRFNVGDNAHRRLGSSSGYGAYADVFVGPLAGTIEWTHYNAVSQPRTAVNDVAGHLCLGTGTKKKDWGLGLCIDGRHTTGDVRFGNPAQSASAGATYFGLTLGLGTSVSGK